MASSRGGVVANCRGDGDEVWDAVVTAVLASGQAHERTSRYGDKPALYLESREIAHLEAPGVIDLRITRDGWSRAKEAYRGDPIVRRDPSRRDWIELELRSAADVDRVSGLIAIAVEANKK